MIRLSFAICTYNRAELLQFCLDSFIQLKGDPATFEILLINNNSSDNTLEVAERYNSKFPHFRIITEHQTGLSYARNRAILEAQSPWVAYIDDDAKIDPNYAERCFWIIDNTDYLCFGGVYLPWYKYGKPFWYQDKYGSNKMPFKKLTPLKTRTLAGGVMVINKELLQKYNGYPTDIGMIGNSIGYGEETELQLRMRKDGIKLAYDPNLIINHVVAPYKMNLDWFFKSAYSMGRDMIGTKHLNISYGYIALVMLVAFAQVFVHLLVYTPKLLFPNYYTQNWLIDVFKKPTKRAGIIYTALKRRSKGDVEFE